MSVAYLEHFSIIASVPAPCPLLFVLALAGESELILWLSIGNLVDAEPLVGRSEKAGKVPFDVLDVVELRGQWVVDVNHNDLPVGLFLVEQSHDAKDLDLLDLSGVANELANLADIKWIIVSLCLGLWVNYIGVFPSLADLGEL